LITRMQIKRRNIHESASFGSHCVTIDGSSHPSNIAGVHAVVTGYLFPYYRYRVDGEHWNKCF